MHTTLHPAAHQGLCDTLKDHAVRNHAKYPQYEGMFDTWYLRQVHDPIHFKGYSEFSAGEIVLCAPAVTVLEGLPVTLSTYCPRTGSICSMPWENTREITLTDL